MDKHIVLTLGKVLLWLLLPRVVDAALQRLQLTQLHYILLVQLRPLLQPFLSLKLLL
jgi:hypothetical protein